MCLTSVRDSFLRVMITTFAARWREQTMLYVTRSLSAILDAILTGKRDPVELAQFCHRRVKIKKRHV